MLSEQCISDLVFDEWHAAELDAPGIQRAAQHLASCARCQGRQRALQADAHAFLAAHPKPPSRGFAVRRFGVALTGLAVAAGAFLVLRASEPIGERSKGGPTLGFFVSRDERVFPGATGERLHPGDRLRFVASSNGPRQLAVLSRDAHGVASVYYPAAPRSRALETEQPTPLEAAVELDGTLGKETLYGVFCANEFEVEPLRAALERSGQLPALPGCSIDVLEILKEVR